MAVKFEAVSQKTPHFSVGFLISCAIVFGSLQNVILTFIPNQLFSYIDDGFIALAFLFSFSRFGRVRLGLHAGVAAWFIVFIFASLYAIQIHQFEVADVFFLFRQITVPALLILLGAMLSRTELQRVLKITILVALLNVIYMFLEMSLGRIIDPSGIARTKGLYIYSQGVPGYYLGFSPIDGQIIERLGGFILNPPTTGILLGTAAVISFFAHKMRYRRVLTVLFILATLLTVSRAGLLIVALGILLPLLAKRLGGFVALVLVVLLALPLSFDVASHGGSSAHVEGLLGGIKDVSNYPFGRGFGFAGNFAVIDGAESESLLGIAFSAGGLIPLVLVFVLFAFFATGIGKKPESWMYAIGVAAISVAAFAETASSLTGAIPLWVIAGFGLTQSGHADYSHKKAPTTNDPLTMPLPSR